MDDLWLMVHSISRTMNHKLSTFISQNVFDNDKEQTKSKICKFAGICMKILTYLITLTVIILSLKPAIDAIPFLSEKQQTFCSSAACKPIFDNQDSDKESDKEENGMCNPFQACGSCLLICVTTPFVLTPQSNFSTEEFFGYQSFFTSQLISDFWQPPKFV